MPALTGFGAFDDIPAERISDKITRRTLSGEQGMMVWWSMKAGAHAAAHSKGANSSLCIETGWSSWSKTRCVAQVKRWTAWGRMWN